MSKFDPIEKPKQKKEALLKEELLANENDQAAEEDSSEDDQWKAFSEITQGDFKRLIGCGG